MVERLCIIGVGLIGGSIAKSAKQRGICGEIVGVDVNHANLDKAKELSIIDFAEESIYSGVRNADLVVITTPVRSIENVLLDLKPVWSDTAVYTDALSAKVCVIDALKRVFGKVPANFIPGHPIAGSEKSGVEAAIANLFRDKQVVLIADDDSYDRWALKKVEKFWSSLGAEISIMDACRHDKILAATSHLPHVIAYALTDMLGRKDEQDEIFRFAAGGFKDFSRIASSDPSMWLDICLNNRHEIIDLVQQMIEELGEIAFLLEKGKSSELYEIFSRARSARNRFTSQYENHRDSREDRQ